MFRSNTGRKNLATIAVISMALWTLRDAGSTTAGVQDVAPLRASSIEIVDAEGRVRAKIGELARGGGFGLEMSSPDGWTRVVLGIGKNYDSDDQNVVFSMIASDEGYGRSTVTASAGHSDGVPFSQLSVIGNEGRVSLQSGVRGRDLGVVMKDRDTGKGIALTLGDDVVSLVTKVVVPK